MSKAGGRHFNLWIGDDAEQLAYFDTCARIRDITPHSLLRRLLAIIVEEQMVAAVLDDADQLKARRPGEHAYRERHR